METAGGNAAQKVQNEVERVLATYPTVQVQTRFSSKHPVSGVNQLPGSVYALLALAVLIALIGIVNTLMLSVFERTGEIGLLRAVGMKRSQIRSMVRSESVIISVFGAVIGIVVGPGLGLALVRALKLSNSSVPVPSLVVFLVLSALLGLVAATWPARRAAKLDILAADKTDHGRDTLWDREIGPSVDRRRALGASCEQWHQHFFGGPARRDEKRAWLRPGPPGPGKRCLPAARAARLPGAPRLLR